MVHATVADGTAATLVDQQAGQQAERSQESQEKAEQRRISLRSDDVGRCQADEADDEAEQKTDVLENRFKHFAFLSCGIVDTRRTDSRNATGYLLDFFRAAGFSTWLAADNARSRSQVVIGFPAAAATASIAAFSSELTRIEIRSSFRSPLSVGRPAGDISGFLSELW